MSIYVANKVKRDLQLNILNSLGVNKARLYGEGWHNPLFSADTQLSNDPYNPMYPVDPANDTYLMPHPKLLAEFSLTSPVFSLYNETKAKVNLPEPLILEYPVNWKKTLILSSPMFAYCATHTAGTYEDKLKGTMNTNTDKLKLYRDELLVMAIPFVLYNKNPIPYAVEDFADGDTGLYNGSRVAYIPAGTPINHTFLLSLV